MEEKERYVIRYDLEYNQCLIDIEENQGVGDYIRIAKLLNKQDKRIKKLETCLDEEIESNVNLYNLQLKTEKENQQLKQQLHDLHKKIVKEIRKQICEDCFWEECEEQHCEFYFIIEYLNAILKKYGDGE